MHMQIIIRLLPLQPVAPASGECPPPSPPPVSPTYSKKKNFAHVQLAERGGVGAFAICLAISFVLTNQLLAPISTGCLRLSPSLT